MHTLLPSVLLAAASLLASPAAAQSPTFEVGRPLPHIHLPDVRTGLPVDLEQYRGKKLLIAEFASW